MSECGFIGLGRMGGPMAQRLVAAGHRVVAFDTSETACAALAAHGAAIGTSARAVADAVPVVFLSLPSIAIVEDAVLGAEGLGTGSRIEICVDLSTSGPATAIRLAAALAGRGIASLEAPVSGGVRGAREGTLSLMIAGPQSAWERVQPLLAILGKPFYLGETAGSGQTMKLVNNLLSVCSIAITAEGIAIGARAGLDPARMIEVLNVSTGRNGATLDKWPRAVLPRSFDAGFAAGLALKDLDLCLDAARELGVPLAVGNSVRELLARTVGALGAGADFTEIAKIVERDAGLDPDRSQN